MEENKTYRIRTKVGDDADKVIQVKLDQHYDNFEILSLKIDQTNNYKTFESDYGVVVGRVLANGGFGIPNAKVSIFIESDGNDKLIEKILYPYKSPTGKNADGVRYNLLTDFLDKACYQNVGTFPNKRLVLDNDDVIDIFDKYYRYTTVTNNAGDYMIFGVPTGSRRLHVDIDLSDIGVLSQRPRDMIYKGYDVNLFDSPNKFKRDTNLNSLAQIISQDLGIYVYPYWGDTSDDSDNIAVTRADINIDYKFEPTCVFMGSIVTDTGSNAIGKNCTGTEKLGKMSELIAGEGSIEMIRKTIDGKVEEFQVKGNRVIDGDGVWCYQIPMNLDYIMTDEFGNMVPSDNPEKGIPTRTRVRFRISLDDAPDDNTARKRCRYLVPNNPRLDEELYPNFNKTKEVDYEFGTKTKNENYRDLLWNKVYTVKNYVPRLQKNRKITDRKHTGIKLINHHEGNNPMPYNNVDIKLGFTYRMMCVIFKIFINLVQFLNQILTALSLAFCAIYSVFDFIADKLCFKLPVIHIKPLCWMAWPFRQLAKLFWALIVPCVGISSDMCGENTTHNLTFFPGCGNLMFSGAGAGKLANCIREKTEESLNKKENNAIKNGEMDESERTVALLGGTEELYNCVETALAEDNDTISLNFQNDWVNGTLYAPMWFRKITKKRTYLFGLIKRRAKDQWCEGEKDYTRKILRVFNPCSPIRKGTKGYTNFDGLPTTAYYMNFSDNKRYGDSCRDNCHKSTQAVNLDKGLIVKRQTMLGQDVYYYKPVEYTKYDNVVSGSSDDYAQSEDLKGGSVKILFATDIVLLGSLNDCDIHGVPQFFKSLESTTFQIPPNILFTDNEIRLEMERGSTSSGNDKDPDNVNVTYHVIEESVSEMAGMDWGNYNEDLCGKWNDSQDSGLFYSIGCSTIKMKPKSCVNMTRICEFGVSLDETKSILGIENYSNITGEDTPKDDAIYQTIVPDGFISKDELYNDDERSLFATLNVNGLVTKRNPDNSLMEYAFKHVVVDNFDKSLYEYMAERQRKCTKTTRYNYLLEEFSNGYYDFRMGRHPYFYDKKQKFPRYENSFYFYFGLNPGKTAIDKFNSQFVSNCLNDGEVISPIGIDTLSNDWCGDMYGHYDGYVAFDLSAVDLPCDIIIRRVDRTDGTSDREFKDNAIELFYLSDVEHEDLNAAGYVRNGNGLPNGTYEVILTDNNGEIIVTSFSLKPKALITHIVPTDFYEPDNVLMKRFNSNRDRIASDVTCLGNCNEEGFGINSTREIGGTIAILRPRDGETGEPIDFYDIYVNADNMEDTWYHYAVTNSEDSEGSHMSLLKNCEDFIIIGVPKGDENYTITITQLCKDDNSYNESGNVYVETVRILEKSPYKLFINGTVDYDVIKHWKSGFKVTVNASTKEPKIEVNGNISPKWWHMSNPDNYLWCFYQPYIDADDNICEMLKMYNNVLAQTDDNNQLLIDQSQLNTDYKNRRNSALSSGGSHFMYSDLTTAYNDNDYPEGTTVNNEIDFGVMISNIESEIATLSAIASAITDEDSDVKKAYLDLVDIDTDIVEVLNDVLEMKRDFINNTKMAFQLTCSESYHSMFFTVQTKDRPVYYHGVYRPEMTDENGFYTLEEKAIYTNEGDSIDTITIPTITHTESERYGNKSPLITESGDPTIKLCFASDNISTYKASDDLDRAKNRKLAYFISTINGRGKTIPNDAEYLPESPACSLNEKYEEKTITEKYFGYHIIDKIFENRFMMWSYFDRLPYYQPLGGNGCIDETKAGASICMNGIFASKIFNGNATEYRVVYVKKVPDTVDMHITAAEYAIRVDEQEYYTKYYHLKTDNTYCDDSYISEEEWEDLGQQEKSNYEETYVRTSNFTPNRTISQEEYDDLGTEEKNKYTKSYETIFEEQQLSPFELNIYTGRGNNETDEEVEDKMPTVRYVVGEKWADGLESTERHFDNFRVTAKTEEYNTTMWNLYKQQYASVNNRNIDLVLIDENQCQLVDTLDGRMKVVLSEDSVNLCSTNNKNHRDGSKFHVTIENENGDDVRYFVFTTDREAENDFNEEEFTNYPLNHAVAYDGCSNQMLCRKSKYDMGWNSSTDENSALFKMGEEQNLFSYYSNPVYFDGIKHAKIGNVVARKQLASKYINPDDDKETKTEGWGNTGEFEMERHDRPYFVVAITDNNCRAISPVYDYSYVCARLIFGLVYTKQETTDEYGNVNGYEYVETPKMTFDVANAVKHNCNNGASQITGNCVEPSDILYYFYYYPYSISFTIKLDDISTVSGEYTHVAYHDDENGYQLFDLDSHAYDKLLDIYHGANHKVGKTIRGNTVVEARDYTGLRHIVDWRGCAQMDGDIKDKYGCGEPYVQYTWVTITWVTNGGLWTNSGDPNKYVDAVCANEGDECDYYGSSATFSKTFKVGDKYKVCDVGKLVKENCENESELCPPDSASDPCNSNSPGFLGWSTSYDSTEVITSTNEITINGDKNESMIYYAVWACDSVGVKWLACDEEGNYEIGTECGIPKGTIIPEDEMPKSLDPDIVYVGWTHGDSATYLPGQGYMINGDTVFTARCAQSYNVKLRFTNYIDLGGADHIDLADIQVEIGERTININNLVLGIGSPQLGHNSVIVEPNQLKGIPEHTLVSFVNVSSTTTASGCDVLDDSDCNQGETCCSKRQYGHDGQYSPRWTATPLQIEVGGDSSSEYPTVPLIDILFIDDAYIDCSQLHTVRFLTRTGGPSGNCELYVYSTLRNVCHNDFVAEYRNPVYMRFDGFDVNNNNSCIFVSEPVYEFTHWSDANGTTLDPRVMPITGDIDFYANWSIPRKLVSFYVDGQQVGLSVMVEVNSSLRQSQLPQSSAIDALVPAGQEFDGTWTPKVSIQGQWIWVDEVVSDLLTYIVTTDTQLHANLRPVGTHRVRYVVNNETIKQEDVSDGGFSTPPTNQEVEEHLSGGATFDGTWIDGNETVRTTEEIRILHIYDDYTFTAILGQEYTVKFFVDNNELTGHTQTVDAGDTVTAPTVSDVTSSQYFPSDSTFDGHWSDGNTIYTENDINQLPINSNYNFSAVLGRVQVTYEFNWLYPEGVTTDQQGNPLKSDISRTVDINSIVTVPFNSVLADYSFSGFDLQGDASSALVTPGTQVEISSNCVYDGVWENLTKDYYFNWVVYNHSRLTINGITVFLYAVNQMDSSQNRECEAHIVTGGGFGTNDYRNGNTISIKALPQCTYVYPLWAKIDYAFDGHTYQDVTITTSHASNVAYIDCDRNNHTGQFSNLTCTINYSCITQNTDASHITCPDTLLICLFDGEGAPTGPFAISYYVEGPDISGSILVIDPPNTYDYGTLLTEASGRIPNESQMVAATGNPYKYSKREWKNGIDPENRSVTGNASYTMLLKIREYYATFVWVKGNWPNTQFEVPYGTTVPSGDIPTASDGPTVSGFTFNGWSPNPETTVITQSQTFTAQWLENSPDNVTVTFRVEEKNNPNVYWEFAPVTVTDGEPLPSNVVPSNSDIVNKTGNTAKYEFDSWQGFASGQTPANTPIDGDTTFIAIVKVRQYKATFVNNGEQDVITWYNYGDNVDMPQDPTNSQLTFNGWRCDDDNLLYTYGDTYENIVKNVVFTAEWKARIQFKVVDDDNNEAVLGYVTSKQKLVTIPYTIVAGDVPTNAELLAATQSPEAYQDFDFDDNWAAPNGNPLEYGSVQKNVTFTALMYKKRYTVTFNPDNGEQTTTITPKPKHGDTITLMATPLRDGYTFNGWKSSINNQTYNAGASYTVTSDVTFTAQWTQNAPNQHTVTFVFGHGQQDVTRTVNDGYTVVVPSIPTVEGYHFKEWDGDVTQPITSDVTFTAIWQIVVIFKAEGSVISTQNIDYNGHVTIPSVTVASGRRFKNAWTKEGHSTQYSSDTVAGWAIQEPLTLVAVIVDVYTVEFYVYNNGTETRIGGVHTVESGNHVTPPDDNAISNAISGTGMSRYSQSTPWRISNANGTFNTYGDTYTTAWFSDNGITSNMKLFLRTAYSVTFDFDQSGYSDVEQSVEQGHHASVPSTPTIENCTFTGWSSSVSGLNSGDNITANVTFTAQWDCQEPTVKHTVRFIDNGATISTYLVNDGSTLSQSGYTVPTASGANFVGWVYFVGGERKTTKTASEVSSQTITADCDFQALYRRNYTINYRIQNEFTSTTDNRSYPTKLSISFGYQLGTNPQMTEVVNLNGSDIPSRGGYKTGSFTISNFDFVSINEFSAYNPDTYPFDDLGDGWYTVGSDMQNYAYYKLSYSGDYSGTTYNPDAADSNVVMIIRLLDQIEHNIN